MTQSRLVTFLLAGVLLSTARSTATEFEVTYTRAVRPGPVSARVYVMVGLSRKMLEARKYEPRNGPGLFLPEPCYAVDAKAWEPGEPLNVGADALGTPGPPSTLPPGDYVAQAVVRLNPDTHKIGDGVGNAYGPIVPFKVGRGVPNDRPVRLAVDTVVKAPKLQESDRIKFVEIESPLLSAFHGRPIKHRATVALPANPGPDTSPAALYVIPGFGGDHVSALRPVNTRGNAMRLELGVRGDPAFDFGKSLIRVYLDPDCGTGHHAFADSAFNGPRGRALVEELIPHIERTFHAGSAPRTRLLNGHSSGGWSSLWLQVTYPDTFGGVWTTSPDPVDFRDFQKVNLYAPGANLFRDAGGRRRPISRLLPSVLLGGVLYFDTFSKMEDVIGDGGQLHSFEAVFSPLGPEGRPRPLYDRATGAVDPQVAGAWEAYDIRLKLERNWPTLGPKLKGKLRVFVGDRDTFLLEGPVKLLKASLEKLGSDAVVEVVPGRDHFNLMDPAFARRFDREMTAASGL